MIQSLSRNNSKDSILSSNLIPPSSNRVLFKKGIPKVLLARKMEIKQPKESINDLKIIPNNKYLGRFTKKQ